MFHITKCIYPNCKTYLSKMQSIFVQIEKYIAKKGFCCITGDFGLRHRYVTQNNLNIASQKSLIQTKICFTGQFGFWTKTYFTKQVGRVAQKVIHNMYIFHRTIGQNMFHGTSLMCFTKLVSQNAFHKMCFTECVFTKCVSQNVFHRTIGQKYVSHKMLAPLCTGGHCQNLKWNLSHE